MWDRRWSDPDIAVESAVLELIVQSGTRIAGWRRNDIYLRDALLRASLLRIDVGALRILKLGLEVATKLGVLGDDRNVQVAGPSICQRGAKDETAHETRDEDSHDEKTFCTHALDVTALCDEP